MEGFSSLNARSVCLMPVQPPALCAFIIFGPVLPAVYIHICTLYSIAKAGGRARLVQVMMERPGGLLEWEGLVMVM